MAYAASGSSAEGPRGRPVRQPAAAIAEKFDPPTPPTNAMDIIELHNVQQYLERGYLPHNYTEPERSPLRPGGADPKRGRAVLSSVGDSRWRRSSHGVDHDYHSDLLELLGRNKAFERCNASTMCPPWRPAASALVRCSRAGGSWLPMTPRCAMRFSPSPRNGEHLIRKYLQSGDGAAVHLPPSFTPSDARDLLGRYVDSPDVHVNYVGLIETARVDAQAGIDPMLKLRAKRRKAEISEEFFKDNTAVTMKTGCEIALSDTQDEPVKVELNDFVYSFSYSRRWFDETSDNASVLNNVQHLFEFADEHVLLKLPAYTSEMGVLERHLGMRGRDDYHFGMAFQAADLNSLLQTRLLLHVLRRKEIELEEVISWFFEEYLNEQFGASNFRFKPSGTSSTYLERVRHLFAEMESVAAQFSLYVQNGALDRELLPLMSELVRYRKLPTLLQGKYIYPTEHPEIVGILHTMFSDQSPMTYINENLQAP